MNEKKLNIYEKLVEVRKSVPYLQKGESGPQFKYVSSSQTLAAVRQAMDEQNLLLIPKITNKEVTIMDRGGDKASAVFTELNIEYTWLDASDPSQMVICPFYGQGIDIAGEKGVGKALTYAEKYFLLKFFNIATDKDDPDRFQQKTATGNGSSESEEPPEKETKPKGKLKPDDLLTDGQVKLVWAKTYSKWSGREEAQKELKSILRGRYKVESTKEMTQKHLDDFLNYIDKVKIEEEPDF